MSSFAPELWTALGAAISIFLSSFGSCYASAHAGLFAMRNHAQLGIKSFFPVIISGVLAIYGLIIGVILAFKIDDSSSISERKAFHYFGAGWTVGAACFCSGAGMGLFLKGYMNMNMVFPDSDRTHGTSEPGTLTEPLVSSQHVGQTSSLDMTKGSNLITLLCVLVFLEAIGLYGLIVALCLIGR
jgi:ATP synthase proteolipid subunit